MTKPVAWIVEDDPQLGQIYSIALQASFSVELITDGAAALVRLSQETPHVIVLDQHLPGASGVEILAFIHSEPRLAKSSIIVTTADARLAETLEEQGDIVLVKPISPLQLSELAVRLLKSR